MVDTKSGVAGQAWQRQFLWWPPMPRARAPAPPNCGRSWKAYKDVAHLAMAAVVVAADAHKRHRSAPYGLKLHQLQPYRMAMLLPGLVLSVAMSIEEYGLNQVAHGRTQPMFDPEFLWRIPIDINLTPVAPPARELTDTDLAVLKARRAGNRGKAKRRKTTPVSARSSQAASKI